MTDDELDAEYRYLVDERLGILCGKDKPTPEQEKLAKAEAMRWLNAQVAKQPVANG